MLKYDSKPIQMLSRIVDLIVLNLLTILCSVPLITVGAARAALFSCLRQMHLERDNHLIAMYLKQFRSEWKNSTILWLFYVLVGVWMILDIYVCQFINLGHAEYLLMALFAVIFVAASIAYQVGMGLNCFFENAPKKNLINGLVIGMGNFPSAFFLVLLELLPLILIWLAPQTIGYVVIVYSMIGFSMAAYVEMTVYRQIFKKYLPEETIPEDNPEDDYEYDEEEEEKARFDFRSLTDIAKGDFTNLTSPEEEEAD